MTLVTGGHGKNGALSVRDKKAKEAIRVAVTETEAVINFGRTDRPARVRLFGSKKKETVKLTASDATLVLGGNGVHGKVSVLGKSGDPVFEAFGTDDESIIGAGQEGQAGRLTLYDGQGEPSVNLTADGATLELGGNGVHGKVSVLGKSGDPVFEAFGTDDESIIGAGQEGQAGRLTLYDGRGEPTVNLTADGATMVLGGSGADGTLSVCGADGIPVAEVLAFATEAVIGIGQSGRPGRISVFDGNQAEVVRIDGQNGGDIWIANGDCAEEFDAVGPELLPGTVVVLAGSDAIEASAKAYDRRVAGVISGAGAYRPGLVLDRRASRAGRATVAILGKVHCLVDADAGAIEVGDLLTSADTGGHAMRASDPQRAFGSVIGKAMAPMASGKGLLPILVMCR
jgi:hypothetical protein